MKKIVLTFGLISGAILSVMMLLTLPFQDSIGYGQGEVIGYTTMVVAFLLIFFGVRSYRDNVGGGTIRFGRALAVGVAIVAVASICYVATWQLIYYKIAPGYVAKMQAHMLDEAKAEGLSEAALAEKKVELEKFAKMYENPVINASITFLEPLPVGLVIALVTAGILSRRRKDVATGAVLGAT